MTLKEKSVTRVTKLSCTEGYEVLKKNSKAHLVDVRTRPEWMYNGVPNLELLEKKTIFISWQVYPSMKINENFEDEIIKFGIDRQDSILLICRSGNRSLNAANFLINKGYLECYNIVDGFEGKLNNNFHRSKINGWKFNNLPWKQ